MEASERMRLEAEAIQAIRTTPGLKVILSELDRRVEAANDLTSIDDPLWAQKSAFASGGRTKMRELRDWLLGKLAEPDSPPEA